MNRSVIEPTIDGIPGKAKLGVLAGARSLLGAPRPNRFPLRLTRVRAKIAGDCCRTEIEQVFENRCDRAMEVVYIFPVPEDGAVVSMELVAGTTVVKATCRKRAEAEREYQRAHGAGQKAALLTAERDNVHTIRVTNVPAGTSVRVRTVVIQTLQEVDGLREWRFPTVVAPRYTPGEPIGHAGDGHEPDTDAVLDASRISPPLRLAGGSSLDLEVGIAGAVGRVESSLHAVQVEMGDGSGVRVSPTGDAGQGLCAAVWISRGGAVLCPGRQRWGVRRRGPDAAAQRGDAAATGAGSDHADRRVGVDAGCETGGGEAGAGIGGARVDAG